MTTTSRPFQHLDAKLQLPDAGPVNFTSTTDGKKNGSYIYNIYIIYICLQVRDCMVMVLLKASMLEVPSAVAFVVQGLKSNFYGLGCPAYCTSPSVGTFLAFFLLGLVLGFVLCVLAYILRFDLIPTVASTPFAGPCAPSSSCGWSCPFCLPWLSA